MFLWPAKKVKASQAHDAVKAQEEDSGPPSAATECPLKKKPIMLLEPAVDFGKLPQADTGDEKSQVTVSNTGTAELDVKSLKISGGDKAHFELRNQTAPFGVTPFKLAPGASKRFDVVLLPRKVGKWAVTVAAESNSAVKPKQSVAVVADVRGWLIVQVLDQDGTCVPNLTLRMLQKGEPEQESVTSGKPEDAGCVKFTDLTARSCKLVGAAGETLYEFVSLKLKA